MEYVTIPKWKYQSLIATVMFANREEFDRYNNANYCREVIDNCIALGLPQQFINELESDYKAQFTIT